MKRIISILSIIIIITLTLLPLCLGVSAAPNFSSGTYVYVIPNNESPGSDLYKQYLVPYVLTGEEGYAFNRNSVGIFEHFLGSAQDFDAIIQAQEYATIYLFNNTYLTVRFYPDDGYVTLYYYYNMLGTTKSINFYTSTYNTSFSASSNDIHFYVNEDGRLMLYFEGDVVGHLVPNDLYGCVFSLNKSPETIYGQGVIDGQNSVSDRYQEGYEDGYSIGLEEGYENGYSFGYQNGLDEDSENAYGEGYNVGYNQGFSEGQNVDMVAFNAISGFFEGLKNFFSPFFSIGIGSLTISTMLGLVVFVFIGAIVIKILRG